VQFEFAKLSLPGDRSENQDRVAVMSANGSALIAVVDGMGGHAEGAAASEAAAACFSEMFRAAGHPVLDPKGFLISLIERAHGRLVDLGATIAIDHRPRATCAICLVQDDRAYCAHVGDSRIYHVRGSTIVSRSRDHSHVELLLQEGVIDEGEIKSHPMRNYVEYCLGGDRPLPEMSIAATNRVRSGDVLLVCSDGLWTGVDDEQLLTLTAPGTDLEPAALSVAELAIRNNAPHSDNTSVAVVRIGEETS
jgi:serine/threonine protein phosphatase PrpC